MIIKAVVLCGAPELWQMNDQTCIRGIFKFRLSGGSWTWRHFQVIKLGGNTFLEQCKG